VPSLKLIQVPSNNSAKFFQNFLSRLAGSRALPSEDITAIIWDFPAKNPQISLRETSDNRDVQAGAFCKQKGNKKFFPPQF